MFIARDNLDTSFVCLVVERDEESDKYLCVPVSPGRLRRLLDGQVDLREVLQFSETGESYQGRAVNGNLDQIETSPISHGDISEHWLPEEGFFLSREPMPNVTVVEDAHQKQRAIIHCTLRPPEAWEEPKITAEHLSEAVALIQRIVRHAYVKAIRDVRFPDRDVLLSPSNYELEVYAFSPGSFTVQMQTAATADLLGYSQVARALDILDRVNREIHNPEDAVELVAHYGGHFAAAYRDLLEFVIKNDTGISYEWSMPERRDSTTREIRTTVAKPLYAALVERVEIGREERKLTGKFTKLDEKYGKWRLVAEDGSEHSGECDPSGGVTLAGLIIGTQRYALICDERLKQQRGTGRETTQLYLVSYERI